MFVSDYFELDEEQFDKFNSMCVFDAVLDKDSNFFINIIRLKQSTIPEFKTAYIKLNKFFLSLRHYLKRQMNRI